MAISTVIFDMGGVLVWALWERATVPLGKIAGMAPEKVLETIFNDDTHHAYMRGEIDTDNFAVALAASLGVQLPTDEIIGLWNSILAPNREAPAVLEGLKGKVRLVLGSNTDPEHYQRCLEVQPALSLFDDVLLSYELEVCKPDPRFFTTGLPGLGLTPEECVFIDDMAENVESATSLGITGIQFQSMGQVERDLARLGIPSESTGPGN